MKLSVALELDTGGATTVDQHPADHGVGLDEQVGSCLQMRQEVGARGAASFAILLRDLIDTQAFLLRPVEVIGSGEASLSRCIQKTLLIGHVTLDIADPQRPFLPMPGAAQAGIAFTANEVRQYLGIAPTRASQTGPLVVIPAMSADIEHRVDRRSTAEHLAARLVATPAVQAFLWHRMERPVVQAGRQHGDRTHWQVDNCSIPPPTRLDHADSD